jgi:hypothetical protein
MIVAATVREKAATSDVVFGMGCRKGTSLRELRVRATLRPTCAEPASRFHKAGMAPTKLAQDAQPSRLPRCHQARAPATRPAHQQARLSQHPISSTTSRPCKCPAVTTERGVAGCRPDTRCGGKFSIQAHRVFRQRPSSPNSPNVRPYGR